MLHFGGAAVLGSSHELFKLALLAACPHSRTADRLRVRLVLLYLNCRQCRRRRRCCAQGCRVGLLLPGSAANAVLASTACRNRLSGGAASALFHSRAARSSHRAHRGRCPVSASTTCPAARPARDAVS